MREIVVRVDDDGRVQAINLTPHDLSVEDVADWLEQATRLLRGEFVKVGTKGTQIDLAKVMYTLEVPEP